MNKTKGFTIIELIVVIAIIAVLAAIVLVNVTQYIAKGRDAAIKGNYSSLMTNAAQFFDLNPTSTGANFAASSYMINAEAAVTNAKGTPVHNGVTTAGDQNWCACSTEVATSTTSYCVDNTGAVVEKTQGCDVACTTPTDGKCH